MSLRGRFSIMYPAAALCVAVLLLAGCPARQQQPQPPAPVPDRTQWGPADEYKFLVDLRGGMTRVLERENRSIGGDEESLSVMQGELADVFTQKSIMAEANEAMVRAHGEYSVDPEKLAGYLGGGFPVGLLGEIGTATVGLPSHLDVDRWVAHLFIANPGSIAESIFEGLSGADKKTESEDQETEGTDPLSLMVKAMGLEDVSDLYSWMTDEFFLVFIVNPDFDPEAIQSPADLTVEAFIGNPPICPIIAVSSDEPGKGLDVLQTLGTFLLGLGGTDLELERTTMGGFDALTLPVEDLADEMSFADKNERDRFVLMLGNVGPSVAVSVPGYVLIGAPPAMEAALDALLPQPSGAGRSATVELAWNWDFLIGAYKSSYAAFVDDVVQDPAYEAIREPLGKLDRDIRELGELGVGSMSFAIQGDGNFDMDILTSKASIRLMGLIQQIFEQGMLGLSSETPAAPETGTGTKLGGD